MLRSIYSLLNTGFHTALWGGLSIIFSLLPVKTSLPYRMGIYWSWWLYFLHGVSLSSVNREQTDFSRPMVVMSNHRSLLDIPGLMSSFPIRLYFVAKKSLRNIPIFGYSLDRLGMVYIDRKNVQAARDSFSVAARQVREGKTVVMFPEGSRSPDGKTLQPLKKGGFHLALQARQAILPVAVIGSEKALPKYSLSIHPAEVKVCYGRPIEVDENSSLEGLMAATRLELLRLIAENE